MTLRALAFALLWRFAGLFAVMAACMLASSDARAGNQTEEYQNCTSNAAAWLAASPTQRRNAKCTLDAPNNRWILSGETWVGFWSESNVGNYNFTNTCSSQPPLGDGWFSVGSGPICKDACSYGANTGPDITSVHLFPGTPAAIAFKKEQGGQSPTGQVCQPGADGVPEAISGPQCTTVGTLTQCMLPNGKHCAQSSGGKLFCWQPNETGTKVSSNDAANKTPDGKPNNPPPIPPANNGEWEQTGSGTTTINNNGNTTNYNTNTYGSSSGPVGDGGGATNPDGSEEPGDDGGEDDDKGNTVSGGAGCGDGAAPTCSGSSCTAEAFAILIQQWRARCADEEARGQFDTDATSGAGDAAGDDHGGMLATLWGSEAEAPSIDHNKVSIGGGLVIPTVTIFDQTWTAPPEFYDALGIIKFIVIASFTIAGLVVLWNR